MFACISVCLYFISLRGMNLCELCFKHRTSFSFFFAIFFLYYPLFGWASAESSTKIKQKTKTKENTIKGEILEKLGAMWFFFLLFSFLNQKFMPFVIFLFTLTDVMSASAAILKDPRFLIHGPSYAYLDCSACLAFAGYLGERMNASLEYDGRGGASFLATHRLNKENKLQRNLYATSELRAVEVLEKICSVALEENYVLHLDIDRRIRVYQSGNTDFPYAQHYSVQDSDALKVISKTAVRDFCTRLMDEEEEAMMNVVREVRELAELELRLCGGNDVNRSSVKTPLPKIEALVTAVCIGTEASIAAELGRIQRYEKWQESISRRREEAIKKIGGKSEEPIVAKEVVHGEKDPQPWFSVSKSTFSSSDSEEGDDDDEGGLESIGIDL
ncbi:hypothetical protein, conserved [Trypanosoma cruzi]|uniref:DUF3456 domain-containing protein n=2 Tax=Trypanosoma cruzi TaxID=5693 RepID=Q4CZ44_TRYCC|nr:hypothetical protein, conserved [Trypanosoma cruzi]EAN85544.1 hypothetical protein, conserved [Trypanosoma cruzi]|eukprot:XP_807395.1 hypothetical protein [Trypanosoma cruzi strain CL Brener]